LYYLGLDISTSKIGIALLNENKELICSDFIKLNSKDSLEKRAEQFYEYIYLLYLEYERKIDSVFLEQPFVAMFGGSSSAVTTSTLNIFSGMCRYVIYGVLNKEPVLVDVRKARSSLGIRIPRGTPAKSKKQMIIDYVVSKYGNLFVYNTTKFNNFAVGTDDRADAVIACLYGLSIPGIIS